MTVKTGHLLSEVMEAIHEKKAVLLTGNTGVGKTFLAKQIIKRLENKEYSCFSESSEQDVVTVIISCHRSISYENVVGGLSAETESGKIAFKQTDKIIVETINEASRAYYSRKGTKYVLILDDMQRNDISSLLGDIVNAVGTESKIIKIHLNTGVSIEVTPNFFIIGTYNSAEESAIPLSNEILGKFYVREILSDIKYVTEDEKSDNAIFYDVVRKIVMNNLDMQYKTSTYEQNRYIPGHGYFFGKDFLLKIRFQLIPVLKQYISEGILESCAEEEVNRIESECKDRIKKSVNKTDHNCFSDYSKNVTPSVFLMKDATSEPLRNLIGRIIDQRLLTDDQIKQHLLFNPSVCFREEEVGGITYQAQLMAANLQYEKIKRKGGDQRKLYNGGTLKINGIDYHFTGGMQPKEYTVRHPKRKLEIWNIINGYKIGESTSPNVILFRIVWQYYKVLIDNLQLYLESNPEDLEKDKLLGYIQKEWNDFLNDFKGIKPLANSDANKKAEYNKQANRKVRELISKLNVMWTNVGENLVLPDGTEIVLEGVDSDMNEKVFQEYRDAMETLGIKQMILQGPPGTSKTFFAKAFLKYMAHNCSDTELADIQIADYSQEDRYCAKLFKGKGDPEIAWDIVQFHPSYGYEDFIRGIKVSTKQGSDTIMYETVNKVLGSIAELARKHKKTKFFLIIDEINRANLATVFGELIYALEYRQEPVATPYTVHNSNRITIPDNLYIIGTMNTADKSIGGIDYAIRRRFLFFEQLPDESIIKSYKMENGQTQTDLNMKACQLFNSVKKVFEDEYLSPEYRKEDVQIGHTYFLVDSEIQLQRRFEYQIVPILKEYYKDGIITFDADESTEGFSGFLNCIAGKISMTTQKNVIDQIFKSLIA